MGNNIRINKIQNKLAKKLLYEENKNKLNKEIFKELLREYEFEFHRSEKLDEKAIHLGTSAGALVTFFLGFILVNIEKVRTLPFFIFLFNFVFIEVIFILLFFSIYMSYRIIDVMPFSTLNPDKLIEEYKDRTYSDFFLYYREDIQKSINYNRENGDNKARKLRYVIKAILASLITLFIYLCLIYGYQTLLVGL